MGGFASEYIPHKLGTFKMEYKTVLSSSPALIERAGR